MSKATQQLADKEFYHDLTPKQKGVIDAYAKKPEGSHTAILRIANEILKESGESVTRAYVPVVLSKYDHIAKEQARKETSNQEGEDGKITEQNALKPLANGGTNKEDAIPVDPVGDEREITISLTQMERRLMADEQLPESIRLKLLRPLLDE